MRKGKKRILVLASTFPRWKNDSTPPFIYELEKRLAKDFEIHVLAPHHQGAKKEEIIGGLHIHRFQYFWPEKLQKVAYGGGILPNLKKSFLAKIQVIPFIFSEFISLMRITSAKKIEIIHSHWVIPHGFLAEIVKKILKLKHISTIHAGDLALLDRLPFKRLLARFIVNNTDYITFVSRFGKDLFVKILGQYNKKIDNKLLIIPMGIDTKVFSQSIDSFSLKEKFKVADKKIILFIGRLAEKKGVKYLIQSILIVAKTIKKIKVYVVGEGPLKEELLNFTKELGLGEIVEFTGSKTGKDKLEYFAMADILTVPSVKTRFGDVEGIPVVLMEGLSSGKAIVASSVGGIPEIITNNVNGLLVLEKNIQSLAQSIINVLTNDELKSSLEKEARKSSRKYDLKIIAEKFKKIYSVY